MTVRFWSWKKVLFLQLLWAVAVAGFANTISQEKLAENHYLITLETSEYSDISKAQQALWPEAEVLCKAEPVTLGKYQYELLEPLASSGTNTVLEPTVFIFKQELHCGDVPLEQLAPLDSPPALLARPAETRSESTFKAMTQDYFTAIHDSDFPQAYGMLGQTMQASSTLSGWTTEQQRFLNSAGDLLNSKILQITIYDNPPSAPEPGIYVAVDFSQQYSRIPYYCGYMIWFQETADVFKIIRQEISILDQQTFDRIDAEQLQQVLRQLGCTK